jgi:hypothetical protein
MDNAGFWVQAVGIALSAVNETVKDMGGFVDGKITDLWTTNGSPSVTLTIRFDAKALHEYASRLGWKGGDTCSK